ncbi:hypothetical protein NDU88_007131 [Pleurodeles waltl]|uniref:Uncharacterized protein n=1 Tax=Pleurodeles waltl TaxID=8319 RepID=A0AAV7QQN6_PLEWA|nr:hypothetical protein NDU88_007131 [Pleurodeles waltl]
MRPSSWRRHAGRHPGAARAEDTAQPAPGSRKVPGFQTAVSCGCSALGALPCWCHVRPAVNRRGAHTPSEAPASP